MKNTSKISNKANNHTAENYLSQNESSVNN